MASGGDIYSAAGFKCTEQDVADFMEMVYSYWNKHQYPALRKQTAWKIQLLKPSQRFKHHSILIQSAETGEYLNHNWAGCECWHWGYSIFMILWPQHWETRPLGSNWLRWSSLSAVNLFDTALQPLKEFGQYDQYTNNCQDYCQVAS